MCVMAPAAFNAAIAAEFSTYLILRHLPRYPPDPEAKKQLSISRLTNSAGAANPDMSQERTIASVAA